MYKDLVIEQTALKFEDFAKKAMNLSDEFEMGSFIDDCINKIAPFDSFGDFKRNFFPCLKSSKSKVELSERLNKKAQEIRTKGTIWYPISNS